MSVLRVVDGCMPSDMATGSAAEIEEERRLLYVAMTRARHHLHLLVPQRFYVTQQSACGDRHVYGAISRFLPVGVRDLFDQVAVAAPPSAVRRRRRHGDPRRHRRAGAHALAVRRRALARKRKAAVPGEPDTAAVRAAVVSASARPVGRQALSTAPLTFSFASP